MLFRKTCEAVPVVKRKRPGVLILMYHRGNFPRGICSIIHLLFYVTLVYKQIGTTIWLS